ncbi:endonuclease/exonuclease/phosphatase family protein [Falsihalocynthiibacter sp. SS001]|uniref:endonuclease/exonuclease/phosphatase family protein n=1 Tax=Falsihalocynthiibacter sp. SS001 TaxID=3349698 RepID=UPI0036D39A76
MRLVTYNTEWFSELFGKDDNLLYDDHPSKRYETSRREQIDALGVVFRALDADAVMIIEAPENSSRRSTTIALENFAERYGLRANKVVVGYGNTTQQEIALLYDPKTVTAEHSPRGGEAPISPPFDQAFRLDIDVDGMQDEIEFSKPPLEIALRTKNGNDVRLIGVHAKSKAPYGAKSKVEEARIAIANRRKQLAQCIWLRHRVDEHFALDEDVIVLGDFNDGPGLDEYEKLFGRSGVEIVLGEEGERRLYDPHASLGLSNRLGALPTTSRFYLAHKKRFFGSLLDYIMVPNRLRKIEPQWRIWHPFDDPEIYKTPPLRDALLTASDHFPVSLDIDL